MRVSWQVTLGVAAMMFGVSLILYHHHYFGRWL